MRYLVIALLMWTSSAQAQNCQFAAGQAQCGSGLSANGNGATTYWSNGDVSQRFGSTTYNSDGTSFQSYGNTTYFSNGTTAQTYGNTTIFSDGRSCQRYGDQLFCY
ncbi:hypothetical protein [Bradyrhizobium sp. ORS 86]|uniref:hypothetical protein n=1 Tax=Bradyrhizobium sp. ORS 86 TaxID=1685970 RepID=UPI00388E5E4E